MIDRGRAYRQLWRVVDGAVFDALYTHQDYLTPKGRASARESIVKRVVGSLDGYVEQSTRGRSGEGPAPDRVVGAREPASRTVQKFAVARCWRMAREAVRQFLRGRA